MVRGRKTWAALIIAAVGVGVWWWTHPPAHGAVLTYEVDLHTALFEATADRAADFAATLPPGCRISVTVEEDLRRSGALVVDCADRDTQAAVTAGLDRHALPGYDLEVLDSGAVRLARPAEAIDAFVEALMVENTEALRLRAGVMIGHDWATVRRTASARFELRVPGADPRTVQALEKPITGELRFHLVDVAGEDAFQGRVARQLPDPARWPTELGASLADTARTTAGPPVWSSSPEVLG